MNCHRVQQHLQAYLDNELGASAREQVTAHLRVCAACQTEWAEAQRFDEYLRATDDLFSDAPGLRVPPDFAARVVAQALAEPKQGKVAADAAWGWWRWWSSFRLLRPAFTLAVIVLAVLCGYQFGRLATPLFVRHVLPHASAPSHPHGNWMELIPRELAALDPAPAETKNESNRQYTGAAQ